MKSSAFFESSGVARLDLRINPTADTRRELSLARSEAFHPVITGAIMLSAARTGP